MKKALSCIPVVFVVLLFIHGRTLAQTGVIWTSQTTPAISQSWTAVTYGNGVYVAVASTGTGNRVMTSPDGVTWTSRATPADNNWNDVTYGNGLFVAVAITGTGNRVMTSPDGITWTLRTTPADNNWAKIIYANGLFVALAGSGNGNRVMTSPDGITWTLRASAANNTWSGLTYGNGLFVAVAGSGTNNRVMTSPDGITWTSQIPAEILGWNSVAYGNGLYVAVSAGSSGSQVMTSPDGVNWTARTGVGSLWLEIVYANGLFVAVSRGGTGNRVMTSPDGITWTARTTPVDNNWSGITYGAGQFVAVANTGAGNQVMTSGPIVLPLNWLSVSARLNGTDQARISWRVEEHGVLSYKVEKSSHGVSFKTIGSLDGQGDGQHSYTFTESQALAGTAYYRIKQIDRDGRSSYSSILTIHHNNGRQSSIYPNPSTGLVTIAVSNHLLNKNAIVTDLSGKVLQTVRINSLSFTLNIEQYPTGHYFIKVDKEKPVKIIKE